MLTGVVGVRHQNSDGSDRQAAIRRLARTGVAAVLRREPENPFDPNAVAVCLADQGGPSVQIGYLNTAVAESVALLLDAGVELRAEVAGVLGARLRPDGSLAGGTLGVELWIDRSQIAPIMPRSALTESHAKSRPRWSNMLGWLRRRDERRAAMGQGRSGHPDPR